MRFAAYFTLGVTAAILARLAWRPLIHYVFTIGDR